MPSASSQPSDSYARKSAEPRQRSKTVMEWLSNLGPLMFICVLVLMFTGFPVAFSLEVQH